MRTKFLVCMMSLLFLVFSGTVRADDIGQSYQRKYQVCIEIQNDGRNLDYDDCKTYDNEIAYEAAGCFW